MRSNLSFGIAEPMSTRSGEPKRKGNYIFKNVRTAQPLKIDREEFTNRPIPVYGYCESFPPEARMEHIWIKVNRTGGKVEKCKNCGLKRTVVGTTSTEII